ncbi:Altered inheritance of mitochondria protein 18 mitochondrial [Lambiella insularis]|nr:Altered inheritance of mitochondria protein 18 mitochondrial [Lambiella insularis]
MPSQIRPMVRTSTQCLRSSLSIRPPPTHRFSTRFPRPSAQSHAPHPNPLDPIATHRQEAEIRAYYTRRTYYAAAGAAFCMFATMALVSTYDLPPTPERSDAPPRRGLGLERGEAVVEGVSGGAELRKAGEGGKMDIRLREQEEVEEVPTGTSTVPYFPKTISLPSTASSTSPALPAGTGDADESYQLVGLGIRTVSFLSIQVYVVGLYLATSDIATLQARLVRKAASTESASTLVSGEKEELRKMLLDADASEQVWDEVLKDGGLRSILRIVPTRNTDFTHLRDGWVRGITARSQGRSRGEGLVERFEDERFGASMAAFKAMFGGAGRKGVGKGKVLMLERRADGRLAAWLEGEKDEGFLKMGEVDDERISRLVWLGYLAGKNVSSENARKSIVNGIMDFVERPVGTVETQVI